MVRRKKRDCLIFYSMMLKHVEHEKKPLYYKAKFHPITESSFAPTRTSYYESLVNKIHHFFSIVQFNVLVHRKIL